MINAPTLIICLGTQNLPLFVSQVAKRDDPTADMLDISAWIPQLGLSKSGGGTNPLVPPPPFESGGGEAQAPAALAPFLLRPCAYLLKGHTQNKSRKGGGQRKVRRVI